MVNLPANVIVLWTGLNAVIPSGFSRETSLDTKFLRGSAASVNPGGTGGASTHTHTVTDHTHTQDAHTHNVSAGTPFETGNTDDISTNVAGGAHIHAAAASASATATNQNATITLDGTSNQPPFKKVIYIKSDGTTPVPSNAITYFAQTTLPTNWVLCDGTLLTPDLRNLFHLGADAGGEALGTGGSSDSHTHTNSAHNHTQNAHTHGANNSAAGSGSSAGGTVSTSHAQGTHRHSVSLNSVTASNNTASITMSNADAQPPFVKLLPIQNQTGGADLPTLVVAIWTGTLAGIPSGWFLCDGTGGTVDTRSKFVKGASNSGEIGTTGGADQHSHTADPHTHTQTAHTHTETAGAPPLIRDVTPGAVLSYAFGAHTHSWTVANATATNQNTTVTIASNTSASNYPTYTDVAFIQFGQSSSFIPRLALLGAG